MSRATSPWRDRVVFLVGARRSGTNWLRRVVDAHPDVAVVPGETYLFSHGIHPLAERIQHGLAGSARTGFVYMDRERFLDATRSFCDEVLDGMAEVLGLPEGGRIAERTPEHVRHLELIGAVYPDAWVVHILRDGRDVARSLVSQDWGPASVAEAAREWRAAVEAGRAAGRSLRRYREVRYEELLADPGGQLAALFRWLGLDASERTLGQVLHEAGVRYNVDPAAPSVGAGKWRDAFSADDLVAFEAVAGDLLSDLGYALDGPSPQSGPAAPARRGPRTGRLRARLAGALEGWRAPVGAPERRVLRRIDEGQVLLDAFMGDVAAHRFDRLERHVSSGVRVRSGCVDVAQDWSGRGTGALQRLARELADDAALRGRQVRADVYPGVPAFTVAAVYETADGTHHPRTFVVGMAGGSITDLGVHRG